MVVGERGRLLPESSCLRVAENASEDGPEVACATCHLGTKSRGGVAHVFQIVYLTVSMGLPDLKRD